MNVVATPSKKAILITHFSVTFNPKSQKRFIKKKRITQFFFFTCLRSAKNFLYTAGINLFNP